VDARQDDDVELSSTGDGDIRPAVPDVLFAAFDVPLVTAVLTLSTAVAVEDDVTVILFVLAL